MNFYKLESGNLDQISPSKAESYFESNVLFYKDSSITIFHIDFDKVKPIVKAIMEGDEEPPTNIGLYVSVGVGLMCLFGLIYYLIGGDSETATPTPTTPPVTTFPPSPVVTQAPIVNDFESKLNLCLKDNDNLLSDISILNERNTIEQNALRNENILNSNISSSRISSLELEISNLTDVKDSLSVCYSENNNLLDDNQLFLRVGKDVLNRCKTSDNPLCKDYIYNFIQ